MPATRTRLDRLPRFATITEHHPNKLFFPPPSSPAMSREELIARKHEVIAEIRRLRRELEALQQRSDRHSRRRARQIEDRLEYLMAEEYRLRLAIDRSK
ncbi:MAG: hypothetical protein D6791_17825 [Chloroflexi bacterium]|nr:MAG: hypothetical protein D6791_17825 [Chloroflexota bacterium]